MFGGAPSHEQQVVDQLNQLVSSSHFMPSPFCCSIVRTYSISDSQPDRCSPASNASNAVPSTAAADNARIEIVILLASLYFLSCLYCSAASSTAIATPAAVAALQQSVAPKVSSFTFCVDVCFSRWN